MQLLIQYFSKKKGGNRRNAIYVVDFDPVCRRLSSTLNRAPVAQLVENQALLWEVVSTLSTLSTTTFAIRSANV